jgi:hypothetical protein
MTLAPPQAPTLAPISSALPASRVPLWLKLVYTAFMAVLVPVYWYNCGPRRVDPHHPGGDLGRKPAAGLDVRSCLLLSQTYSVIDFVANLADLSPHRHDRLHVQGAGAAVPARAVAVSRVAAVSADLSGLALRLDRGALVAWSVLAWALLLTCFFLMPPPRE